MVSLTPIGSGSPSPQTQVAGSNAPSTSTANSPSPGSTTPPVFELLPFSQISLTGLGLQIPRNGDDVDSLLAEVSLQLQAAIAQARDNKASTLASGLTAALAEANSVLAEIQTEQKAISAANTAVANDQAQITTDQNNISAALPKIITDQTNIVQLIQTVGADQATLMTLSPSDPAYATLQSAITMDQDLIQIDQTDANAQVQIVSIASSDIQQKQADIGAQSATIAIDTTAENQLQLAFLQAFILLSTSITQMRASDSVQNTNADNKTSQNLKSISDDPEFLATKVKARDLSQLFAQDLSKKDEANAFAKGIALGVSDLYSALQELVPPINVDPQQAAILNGLRFELHA